MTEIGYTLSSEEHSAPDLIRYAQRAEDAGFSFAVVSDHFHPWIDVQGESPFVWTVLGGIAQATETLRIGTGVTCPLIRTHPVVIAQAAATTASLLSNRFFLGVGSGENLNEHITGERWPPIGQRLDMLEEAIGLMRKLWEGSDVTHRGDHYTVEGARIYSLPDSPPPIYVAASGSRATRLAAEHGDGLIGTVPKREFIEEYERRGGNGKPKYGQLHVCWATTEDDARRTAHRHWPNAALRGQLGQELPLPRHFEQAVKTVTEDDVAETVTCSPDPERHLAAIRAYIDAGYDHVWVHQVGPDQEGFFAFYESDVLPKLR